MLELPDARTTTAPRWGPLSKWFSLSGTVSAS